MIYKDGRGLALTASSSEVCEKLEEALTLLMRYQRDPVAIMGEILEQDPHFTFGRIFRAYLNMFSMDRSRYHKAIADYEAAQACASANDREHMHLRALTAWLEGHWHEASLIWESILMRWPRDLYALKAGYLADYYLGDSSRMRDRVASCLSQYAPDESCYGYLLGMLAFGLEECGDYERAEETGQRAVALNPNDVWAIHAVAHVYEMRGRFGQGIRWMEDSQSQWAVSGNFFAIHNWWHLALYYMELEQYDRVLAIYDGPVRGDASDFIMDLEDASSMLWRCHLFGTDLGNRWEHLAKHWEPKAKDGLYSFNDVHAMMAFLGANATGQAHELLATMEASVTTKTTHSQVVSEVGLPLCKGLLAFHEGAYGKTVEYLFPVRYKHHHMGGSHAQRDVLALTLMEAALRDKQFDLARALLAQRIALQPDAPGNWRKLKRALRGLGDQRAAEIAAERVIQLTQTTQETV